MTYFLTTTVQYFCISPLSNPPFLFVFLLVTLRFSVSHPRLVMNTEWTELMINRSLEWVFHFENMQNFEAKSSRHVYQLPFGNKKSKSINCGFSLSWIKWIYNIAIVWSSLTCQLKTQLDTVNEWGNNKFF